MELNSNKKNDSVYEKHLNNLIFFRAVSDAIIVFVVVRLLLGLFGMDLYEIYWWFAIGLSCALYNINKIAVIKTEMLSVS